MSKSRPVARLAGTLGGVLAVAAPVLLMHPTAGHAQIEEVTVTTRKREESLQVVPLAVTAISADQIERQGISSLSDVSELDPSVQFDTAYGPADTRITIRGLSNTRGRSNVAFLIDGIDVTTENLNAAGSGLLANRRLLSDVERIEVVKGPQSALYGRAAFSGAISYITKNPADVFEGKASMELGDYGRQEFGLALSGPVIDGVLGMRFSSVWYADDGFYTNSLSGEPLGDVDGEGYALTTVYTPTDDLRFKLRGEYSKEKTGPLPNVRISGGRQGYNLRLFEYPAEALAAGLGQNTQFFDPGSTSTSTALINFGQYCPPELQDPGRGPGFCLATNFGNGKGKAVTQGENPLTGRDFDGTDLETKRIALETSLDMGIGTLSVYTGFTDFEGSDSYDQDWQAVGRPDTLLSVQTSNSVNSTEQFSNEFRFASQLDGPIQFTLGSLWWTETRDFEDSAVIIFCTLTRRTSTTDPTLIQDTRDFCNGGNGTGVQSLDNWQDFYRQIQPQIGAPWKAETDSWSFYGTLDWQLAEDWTLTFETRYVSETFNFSKPNQSSCTQFFGPNPGQQVMVAEILDGNGNPINDQVCSVEFALDPEFDLIALPPALTGQQGYRINRGSTTSHFDTPKITLRWLVSDAAQLYFSWAEAEKPGGLATTPGGGSPVNFDEDRFLPEKMTAWELGAKTDWEMAGRMRLNAAGFFQDYTDKQVGTQILQDGFLAPRVINASSAEVWGFEFDFLWSPDFLEGLTLRGAYTYLDATYSTFEDDTTNLLRVAQLGRGCNVVYKGGRGPDPDDLSDPANGNPFCRLNLTGNQLERTPEHAVVTGINYTRGFLDTNYDLALDLTASWQSKRYLEADNTIYFQDYWMLDTSIGLQGDKLDILVYVENLLDDDTIKTGGSGPDFGNQVVELGFTAGLGVNQTFGTLPMPRVLGIRANYKF